MCVRAVLAVARYVAALLRFEAGGVGGLGRDTTAFVAMIATATPTAVTAAISVVLVACIHTESFPVVRIVEGTQHAAIVTATTTAFVAMIATATATAVTAAISVVLVACIPTEPFPVVHIVVGTQHAAIVTATTTAQRCPSRPNPRRCPCSRHSLPFRPLGPRSRIQRHLVQGTVVETERGGLLFFQDMPLQELFLQQ